MIQNCSLDRLYLAMGGDSDIYVDRKLPQHQIDGIRFLYRQFKKKNPGVILNDPPGYGKRVQTVLFLNALTGTLAKPILILCHERDCERWFERFIEWTDLSRSELVVYQTNSRTIDKWIFEKKMKVCIMPITKTPALVSRRDWSVMVLDDETVGKSVLVKSTSKVDFKIFITTLDMKENMELFFCIYKWLYPNGKFNVQKLIEDVKHPVAKSVLLNAFLEDIVLRRNDFLTRFIEAEKINKCIEPKPVVTRKNKDATGTKIKRSKIKLDENNTPALNNYNTEKNNENYVKSPIASETHKENETSDSEMDIETFIRNTKPIRFENYERYVDNTSESGVDDTTEAENGIKTPIVSDTSNSGSVLLFEDSRIENIPKKLTNDFDLLKDIEGTVDDYQNESNDNKDGKNVIDCDNTNGLSLVTKIYENNVHEDDLCDDIAEIKNELVGVIYNNDILRNINTIAVDCEVSNEETVTIKLVDDSDTGKPKELIHDVGNGTICSIENGNNDSVANITTDAKEIDNEANYHKTIDDEIFEIEQTALKKFKGSLLDSIF